MNNYDDPAKGPVTASVLVAPVRGILSAMKNVLIYGGCTSRDAVDHYLEYELKLHSYIARQSLISAFSPATDVLRSVQPITSTFQRRMLKWDEAGTLPEHIRKNSHEIDLVIWDLMIERVGVRPVLQGGFVTNNPQTRAYAKANRLGATIDFGTDRHFDLWSQALDSFRKVLQETNLLDKTVVNATPWALFEKSGSRTHYPDSGFEPTWFNETVQRYWALIEDRGIAVAHVNQADAVADPNHKWGPAYFHYVPETYIAQLNSITALAK